MLLTAYYREFELPWEPDPEDRERFRRLLLIGLALFAILGVILPFIQLAERAESAEEAVPPRLARLMEQERPKPPPPKPVEQPKAEEQPIPKPVQPKIDTRTKMEQSREMRQIRDALADLRDPIDTSALQSSNLSAAVSAGSRADRYTISSRVGRASAGISNAGSSAGFGSGSGALTGHATAGVASNIGSGAGRVSRSGASGKGARGSEEIELMFDRNKGAIYAFYNRALRDQPDLMGKLVLELTITPTGEVTMCRVVSSELKDAELERRIVARVKLFKFETKDVESITATKTIEFFPA